VSTKQPSLRLAACATHPIQYHAPIWRRLATESGIAFEAFFGSDMSVRGYTDREFGTKVAWDTPLTAGYAHTFLSTSSRIETVGKWSPSARGLNDHFRRFRPDVVLLTAYGGRFHIEAWHAARAVGAKVILRHEASDVAATRSMIKNTLRDLLLRQFYARVHGFGVIGVQARRHLLRLGVPADKMVASPYCADTDFFASEVARWTPRRESIRLGLGIVPGNVALVFAGKLIPKKDPLLILQALRLLPRELQTSLHWIVAGDGGLRTKVEAEARAVLGPRAHFLGFLNQSEIGQAYVAGDLLVLPSRRGAGETWGMVANEAMQFGLPVLVSDGVGCGPDLAVGDAGEIFPASNPGALAAVMIRLVRQWRHESDQRSTAARHQVASFSAALASAGLRTAATRAAGIHSDILVHE